MISGEIGGSSIVSSVEVERNYNAHFIRNLYTLDYSHDGFLVAQDVETLSIKSLTKSASLFGFGVYIGRDEMGYKTMFPTYSYSPANIEDAKQDGLRQHMNKVLDDPDRKEAKEKRI